jgi:ABC-type multidrug transport system fused ATPase/permease subunit
LPSYEQVKNLQHQARELEQRSGELLFSGFHQEIAVEDLTFEYPGHKPTLMDVNLRIPKAKMIAVVGESGAGKSTLIDMIMGFNEPLSGRVTFDGVPLERFDIKSYRQRIGYVPQDSILFNMTIRDNLRWANEAATDEEIKQACRQANADEFIERFPDGYDVLVGDRGVRLSGGQCQRVALARAILRKPDLLILDEATSSLDTKSERLIQQAIENIARETTVVVIAHRLSTITNADYVYVLHKGRIVEEGTYKELVRKQGHFSRMTQMQALEAAG